MSDRDKVERVAEELGVTVESLELIAKDAAQNLVRGIIRKRIDEVNERLKPRSMLDLRAGLDRK